MARLRLLDVPFPHGTLAVMHLGRPFRIVNVWGRAACLAIAALLAPGGLPVTTMAARNVVIFVADGLRHGSVNPYDAPVLCALRDQGVSFPNSHALFPTFTTPNAAAIATSHYLGDTGDFGNTLYVGFPIPSGSGIQIPNTQTPFIENDAVLGCLDDRYAGNYLSEETFLALARARGFLTAAVGKLGPTLIQDVEEAGPKNGVVPIPDTVVIDDMTGRDGGMRLSAGIAAALRSAGLCGVAPDRSNGHLKTQQDNGAAGNNETPGTLAANRVQQQFFVDSLTKAILPEFAKQQKPFIVVFWSRDPDGTQHNQGDSLNQLRPGINGPTSLDAVKNADDNLRQILAYLDEAGLRKDTDIFVTSDHGFSTISRHELDPSGRETPQSYAASKVYLDSNGRQEVNSGFLPPGFVGIDLAHHLGLPLFDLDATIKAGEKRMYKPVNPDAPKATANEAQHPAAGNALIGGTGALRTPPDAKIIITADGGSDLLYLPVKDPDLLREIVEFLTAQDYVSGLFTDPDYGPIAGALSLAEINLKGNTALPTPALVINFRSFSTDPDNPVMTGTTVCDTTLQQGQGMHGSFSRSDTWNFMAAAGPDFKAHWEDEAPVGNADITKTLARVLGFDITHRGKLEGRILEEALVNGPATVDFTRQCARSTPAGNGQVTTLLYQQAGETRYFDVAGFSGRSVGLDQTTRTGPSPKKDAQTAADE